MDSTETTTTHPALRIMFGVLGLIAIFAAPAVWDLINSAAGITLGGVGIYFMTIALGMD